MPMQPPLLALGCGSNSTLSTAKYFPAGEKVLSKKMPGLERVKERREKEK